jgi:hypothetical protein
MLVGVQGIVIILLVPPLTSVTYMAAGYRLPTPKFMELQIQVVAGLAEGLLMGLYKVQAAQE